MLAYSSFLHAQWTSLAGLLVLVVMSVELPAADTDSIADIVQPTLRKSCVKCHGAKDKVEGEVNLNELRNVADLSKNPKLLERMIEALDSEEMPPEDEPPLDPERRTQLVTQLRSLLHAAVASRNRLPQTPVRRMNRFQYNNAVRDLFELKVELFALPERMLREYGDYFRPDIGNMPANLNAGSRPLGKSQLIDRRLAGVAPFPQDLRAEHGFDNRGDHLTLSPLLLESFLKLSRSIVESPDFNANTCGIFNSFFAPPPENENPGTEQVEAVVRQRLRQFLTRAFRRPVNETDLDRYAQHVTALIQSGTSFTDSMKEAASAALASPRFLYLYDRAAAEGKARPLDDFELASRLSFFLWGTIPDQELLTLAAEGKLRDPKVLNQQLDRMLRDRRMKGFCDSFPAQWLQLEHIISSVPDKKRFPEFYFGNFRASMHMMLEPLLLFETVFVENHSMMTLIDADFSYRSELLVSWYRDGKRPAGISPIHIPPASIPFRRVQITDRREGGVITNAAVMTMTSSSVRTKPITRGAWIASVIFNNPPKPPPADAPPLPEATSAEVEKLTLRERLDAHSQRADCRSCHAKIDPLGFALENYGPAGVWRDRYENGRAVDPTGVLFRKHEFANVLEFKDAILADKDRFARAFARHVLSYALGRRLTPADSPAVDRIVRETAADDYRIRTLMRQVALSRPFFHKSIPAKPAPRQP